MFVTGKMIRSGNLRKSGMIRMSDFFSNTHSELNAQTESNTDYRVDRSFMTEAYRVNAWIRAIVDLSTERFDQVDIFPMPLSVKMDTKQEDYPDKIKREMETAMKLLMKPNSNLESFSSLKKKVVRDLLRYDEAGIEVVREGEKIIGLQSSVTGEELFVNSDKSGNLFDKNAYLQIRNGKVMNEWGKYDFINFIRNVQSGYVNGFSPIESIADSIMGDLEAMNYNMNFFKNNAKPNIAFLFSNLGFGQGKSALEKAKRWYYQEHRGKPHLPLFMGTQKGEVKLQELTVSNKDMEFFNWELLLISRCMAVYGMQPMVLGILTDTTGKLNSEVQTEQFKKNTIIPLVNTFCNSMNAALVWGDENLNYDDIYLTSANLDIDDDKKQADIWDIFLRDGVITINQVRAELQMPPVPWGNVPFVPLNMSPMDILTEYHESKIEQNKKNAMNNGIDNNTKVPAKKPSAGNKPVPKPAKKDGDIDETGEGTMLQNFDVPTGLERVENTILREAIANIMRSKDSRPRYFTPSLHSTVDRFDLSWQTIMKK